MRVDIMVDLETLGTEPDSTIIQIAAAAFDIRTGAIISEFNMAADISQNEKMKVDGDTIKWWLNTNKQLLADILNRGKQSSSDILMDFHEWLLTFPKETTYLWGNGILFDNAMIQAQFKAIGEDYPIFYRNDRDVRTILELAAERDGVSEKELKAQYTDPSETLHDAMDDVRYQVRLVTGCYQRLMLMKDDVTFLKPIVN